MGTHILSIVVYITVVLGVQVNFQILFSLNLFLPLSPSPPLPSSLPLSLPLSPSPSLSLPLPPLPPYLSLSLSLPVSETPLSDIEDSFKSFINRPDIAIILINQNVCHMMSHDSHMTDASLLQIAEMIRHLLDAYDKPIPSVLEIPSKDHPYDPSKDGILRRAKVSYSSTDGLMSPFHLHPCSLFPSSPSSLSHPVLSLPLLPPHRVCSMLMTSVSPTH